MRAAIFLLLVFSLPFKILAEDKLKNSSGGQAVVIQEEEKNDLGITFLPIIYYTPETKLAFGLGGLFTYRFGLFFKQARPSTLFVTAIYTQMKQFTLQLKPEIYLQKNSLYFNGNFLAERFPSKFWGVGTDTEDIMEEIYTPEIYFMEIGFQKRLLSSAGVYLGVKYHLERTRIVEKEPGKLIDQGIFPGSQGGIISGIGFIINLDNRDNIFYPTLGYYLQSYCFWNDGSLGSDFDYFSLKFDFRNYFRLAENQTLAIQLILDTATGEVPFYKLPRLGGDTILRGYYQGRYRDKNLLALQAEYRFPIWKRLSGVAFAAAGNLADRLKNLGWDNLKYAAGFGLRFKIISKEKANLRVDFAFGPGTYGIYFMAGESF